jgi:activator of HSP90 ATPase
MVVHNPNNWHWVDKNCLPWARSYFNDHLTALDLSSEGSHEFTITSVNVIGDCDVSNRKGKVICIYDMILDITLDGKKDDEEVKGTVKVKEFIHDEDDYEWEYSGLGAHKQFVISELVPKIKAEILKFQDELIESQERDLQQNNVAHN